MRPAAVSFFVGLLFSLGLGLAGMTQPQKIIGFLDLRHWDPSLLFVMIGAVGVHAAAYWIIRNRRSPLMASQWNIPKRKDLTVRLALGAAIFGTGWGLGGFCPGPGITSLFSGELGPVFFVASMLAGMFIYSKVERFIPFKA